MSTVLISGGTGLIGSRLSELLSQKGYKVLHLSRKEDLNAKFPAYKWDLAKGQIDDKALEQADYIITLAGAGIADKRWSKARKQLIIDSRVNGIRLIGERLKALNHMPKAFIGASAIGFYGDSGEQLVDENATAGKGFLSESVTAWEGAYHNLDLNTRTAIVRVGIVLSTQGGALEKMLPTYKAGFGTYFGSGEQIYSWIHLDDVCNIFIHLMENEQLTGTYNATSPQPVSNKQMAKYIATAKGMNEVVFPAPSFGLKLALGEMAAVVLDGSNVSSQKIQDSGFSFQYSELVPALKDLLEKKL